MGDPACNRVEYVIYERSKFDGVIIRVFTGSRFVLQTNSPEARRFTNKQAADIEAEQLRKARPERHLSVELAPRVIGESS